MNRNVFDNTRHVINTATFFKAARAYGIDVAVMLGRADSKWIINQPALFVASLVYKWTPMLLACLLRNI